MAYSANFAEAAHVDGSAMAPILGTLLIEPTKIDLVIISLKTGKALGLTITQSLLLRADQVIE